MDHNIRICQHLCYEVLAKTNIVAVKDVYNHRLSQFNEQLCLYAFGWIGE